MNNEEKRFKQINRIAKPIQVDNTSTSITNQQPSIPPKKPPLKKNKKKISKEILLIFVIIVLSILCICALVFLIVITKPNTKTSSLKYNDATTTNQADKFFISYESLYDLDKIDFASTYNIQNFQITLNNNGSSLDIIVNDKVITSANYLTSKVGFVDDLIMFTTGKNELRTTTFYIVDSSGNIVYDIYNYNGIDGMVLTDSNAVNYNPNSIILSYSRVNNNLVYNNNKIGNNTSANICDEEALFASSIEIQKPARLNYSIEYLGNHKFSNPLIIYEESLSDYKVNNNLCN